MVRSMGSHPAWVRMRLAAAIFSRRSIPGILPARSRWGRGGHPRGVRICDQLCEQSGSGAKGSTGVLHEEHEVEGVSGAGFELWDQVQIEGACLLGFCVHEQPSAADVV